MFKIIKTVLPLLLLAGSVNAQTDTSLSKTTLQEAVIIGIKATHKLPVTYSLLNRKQISARYYGADIPTLIQFTPGINSYSDNGSGIGYSFFRLRGIDQTRINTTVNGIPVNDPENQGVFFNNFADLASSAESIQIQRGVGTSTNGTSAFGGSINLLTKNLSPVSEVKLSTGLGSFGASRVAAEFQSGIIARNFMFYGRYSELKTNGFRQHSGAAIQSYAFSVAYVNKRSVLKLNLFGGNAQSELAFLGIDKATYDANNKTNTFINGETDAFKQQFYQLQYILQLTQSQTLSTSVYYVKGNAPRFQYLYPASWGLGFSSYNMPDAIVGSDTFTTAGDMMSSYRLDQHFGGAFVTYKYVQGKLDFTTGLHANSFVSDHFMEINWGSMIPQGVQLQDHKVYFNTGYKKELSGFIKVNYEVTEKLNLFADLQLRTTSFKYKGKNLQIRQDPYKVDPMSWLFVNPKIGARFHINPSQSVYLMAGMGMREPTRFDYFQDDFATKDTKQNEIKPEQVFNLELGHEINSRTLQSKINIYAMEFTNQIVGLGQVNTFGYQITGNVGKSFRRGLELDINWIAHKKLHVFLSSSFSNNRIKVLNQHYTSATSSNDTLVIYKNSPLGSTPSSIQNLGIRYLPLNWLSAELMYRYVGMQYLDNTGNKNISIPAFSFIDLRLAIQLKQWVHLGDPTLSIQLNNLTDVKYAPAGSLSGANSIDANGNRGNFPLYIPAAGRNYFVTLAWKF